MSEAQQSRKRGREHYLSCREHIGKVFSPGIAAYVNRKLKCNRLSKYGPAGRKQFAHRLIAVTKMAGLMVVRWKSVRIVLDVQHDNETAIAG